MFRCDRDPDCNDATEQNYSSDEQNCALVARIGLRETLLLCLALVGLCWILFFALSTCSLPLGEDDSPPSSPSDQDPLSFLLHPALADISSQSWDWMEVGQQLRLEDVFFNTDPQVLLGFLHHMDAQDVHPEIVHNAFQGFFSYLSSKGFDLNTVAQQLKQSIGHHRLAHMALSGPPNGIDRKIFNFRTWMRETEITGRIHVLLVCSLQVCPRLGHLSSFCKLFLVKFLRAFLMSISPFFLLLDSVKDIVLYLILQETMKRLEESCHEQSSLGFDCLVVSGAEQGLLVIFLVSLCLSFILTSINSFHLRKRLFRTNLLLDIFFVFISPLLRFIYHIQLNQMRHQLDRQKAKLKNADNKHKIKRIEQLSNDIQQTKEIEVVVEVVVQILLVLGLSCFYPYVFKAPSGQSYSYFYGVALLLLKGNKVLFSASLLISVLSTCMFYVNRTNVLRHESLDAKRKGVLLLRNFLFLLVRVLAISSAIFIPVIKHWDPFVGNQGADASSLLDETKFRLEFQKYFRKGLDSVTADIGFNSKIFLLFVFIHIIIVVSFSVFCSAKHSKIMIKDRFIHMVSSFWLPLPFFTIRGVDRGEEKTELWLLVTLHSLENFLIVFVSRWIYLDESYPIGLIIFDTVLLNFNLMGVLVSVLYVCKIELYAGLLQEPSRHPSLSPEVSINQGCLLMSK